MPPIDRAHYDSLVRITEELSAMIDIDHPLVALAAHAARVARDDELPTIDIDDSTVNGQPTPHIKHVYPQCGDTCILRGKWGATGVLPPGHVIVRWKTGMYLAHLRNH